MKKTLLCFILLLIPHSVFGNTFTKTIINGIDFQFVRYGVNSDVYNIKVAVSDDAVPLDTLSIDNNSITAINGVFFCPADYSQCEGKNYTINERFVGGEDLSFYDNTGDRGVFGWDKKGTPFMHQTGNINPDKRAEIFEGLGNFPIIYANGKNVLEHYHDSGLYDIKMRTPLARHFICSNRYKTEIYFGRTGPTSLDNLAPALYTLGCWDALNLDAGNSAQYIYNGISLVSGPRNIIDGFMIERVGLDVEKIEAQAEKFLEIIQTHLSGYSATISRKKIEAYLKILPKIRNNIYDDNSDTLYSKTGEEIGYQINTIALPELKKVYLVNRLEKKLKNVMVNLEEDIIY